MFFVEDSEHFATERERELARQARVKRGVHPANLRYVVVAELLVLVFLVLPYTLVRSLVRKIRRER
jgi:hypothetical protein